MSDESLTPKDGSEVEPDMTGVEENVDTKADAMNEGRGRVRTSSHVFPNKKDLLILKKASSLNNTNTDDLRKVLAFTEN